MGNATRRRRRRERRAYQARTAVVAAERALSAANDDAPPGASPSLSLDDLRFSVRPVDPTERFAQGPLSWYVVRTEPLAEGKVVEGLRERRIPAYCPTERSWRWLRDRRKTLSIRPLFVGYVFAGIGLNRSLYDVNRLSGVEGVVESFGQPAMMDSWALLQIGLAEIAGTFDRTGPKRAAYRSGQEVLVTSGQFAGFIAKVVEAKGDKLRILFEAGLFKGSPFAVNDAQVMAAPEKHVA